LKGRILNKIYLTKEEKYLIIFLALCLFSFLSVKVFNLKKIAIEMESDTTQAIIFPLDINSATYNQLLHIPGIGPVMAQRIIEYRDARGRFNDLQELKEIKGIGDKKLEQLQKYLKI
jgi:competence protein ComEA